MRLARVFPLLACLFASSFECKRAVAAISASGPVALDGGPIRPRREIPDDPLAGLPTDDEARPGKTKPRTGRNPVCAVDAKPANPQDIADLRAVLAMVQLGPKTSPCPPRSASQSLGLRITIDGAGRILAAEAVGNASELASAIAKKLPGKSITLRRDSATTGSLLLTFTPSRRR